jgi:hypothetical protein
MPNVAPYFLPKAIAPPIRRSPNVMPDVEPVAVLVPEDVPDVV